MQVLVNQNLKVIGDLRREVQRLNAESRGGRSSHRSSVASRHGSRSGGDDRDDRQAASWSQPASRSQLQALQQQQQLQALLQMQGLHGGGAGLQGMLPHSMGGAMGMSGDASGAIQMQLLLQQQAAAAIQMEELLQQAAVQTVASAGLGGSQQSSKSKPTEGHNPEKKNTPDEEGKTEEAGEELGEEDDLEALIAESNRMQDERLTEKKEKAETAKEEKEETEETATEEKPDASIF
jgi:hypothetical protein